MLNQGVGLDIGTMNIVAARRGDGDQLILDRMRDAFLDLDLEHKKMLKLSGVSFIEASDRIIIVGDNALQVANLLQKDARRPLANGLISPGELKAIEIASILIQKVLGAPKVKGEVCYYSVPATPVDDKSRDVIYHSNVLKRIISDLGFTPRESNEALAIILSECANENYSGMALSFGSGMVNVALAFRTLLSMSFSMSRSGDWIDAQTAKSLNMTPSRVCALKEKGIDLNHPKDRSEEALSIYYKSLITDAIKHIVAKMDDLAGVEFPESMPIVLSGGTALAKGFLDLFKEIFNQYRSKMKFEISEIRMANNPLTCVAEGLLLQSLQED